MIKAKKKVCTAYIFMMIVYEVWKFISYGQTVAHKDRQDRRRTIRGTTRSY